LEGEDALAWFIWVLCSNYGRQGGEGIRPIMLSNVIETCNLYEAPRETFELVLYIEEKVFPILLEQQDRKIKELEKKK
jgi:hypothetical protein